MTERQTKSKSNSSRDTILAESTRLFAANGFEGVSMRQIASNAGVTLPAIYHHFGNKEELFKTVEAQVYSAHASSLMLEIKADSTPEDRLYRFVCKLYDHLEANPDYLKLLQRNLVDGWEENQKYLVEMSLQGVFDELKKLLNEYANGAGEDVAPLAIFSIIVGFLSMQPVARQIKGYKPAKASKARRRALVIDSVINFVKANV